VSRGSRGGDPLNDVAKSLMDATTTQDAQRLRSRAILALAYSGGGIHAAALSDGGLEELRVTVVVVGAEIGRKGQSDDERCPRGTRLRRQGVG
jgi:hypothetical protein